MFLAPRTQLCIFALVFQMSILAAAQDPTQTLLKRQMQEKEKKLNELEEQSKPLLEMKPVTIDAKDDELRRLFKERFNAAVAELRVVRLMYENDLAPLDLVFSAGNRIVESGLELYDDPKDRIILLTNYVSVAKLIEGVIDQKFLLDSEDEQQLNLAKYHRCDAEIRLLKAKRALGAKDSK